MAVDMFIKIGDIKGESLDKTHAGSIDVLAWSWGASNSGTTHMGGGGGAGKANFQDLSFTKYIDAASPLLLQAVSGGKHYPTTKLTIRKAGDKPVEYLVIDLTEVLVTSYSTGGSGGEDRLTENVTLNFGHFTYSYSPQKQDGTAGVAIKATYDITKNDAT